MIYVILMGLLRIFVFVNLNNELQTIKKEV